MEYYFLWEDSFDYDLYQHGADFYLTKDYNEFVCRKIIGEAIHSTDMFYSSI